MKLEVRGGSFAYEDKKILEDINFKLEEGQVMSILGPNGVGKTTLIKCICGLEKWDEGSSLLDGQGIKTLKKEEIWKDISYVPQSRSFSIAYSGLEMVLLGLTVSLSTFAQPQLEDIDKARAQMEALGIGQLADRSCSTMSGGELQMVLIARALVSDPKIIILDEPESGLDFKNQLIILRLIDRLAHQEGLMVLINTHYPENALSVSDKCLVLKKNRSYYYGPTEIILTEENIEDAFEVEVLINEIDYKERQYKSIIAIDLVD